MSRADFVTQNAQFPHGLFTRDQHTDQRSHWCERDQGEDDPFRASVNADQCAGIV